MVPYHLVKHIKEFDNPARARQQLRVVLVDISQFAKRLHSLGSRILNIERLVGNHRVRGTLVEAVYKRRLQACHHDVWRRQHVAKGNVMQGLHPHTTISG